MDIKKVIKKVKSYNPKADTALVTRAYEFARDKHRDVKRASGEPFIQHPLNTAYILAELKLDMETIVAALLHDVLEDTDTPLDVIRSEFGDEVASLVDGVTKITKIRYDNPSDENAENIRKMLLATTQDIRVIIIKLADRLHNMRTLHYLNPDRRVAISEDTLNVYAPLAYRLGIASVKWELEDISFKYLQPGTYQQVRERFGKKRWQREIDIIKAKRVLERELSNAGIKYEVSGRPKHFYSIYKKMVKTQLSFDELYDIMALRVITDSVKDCYEVLGIVHSLWKPIPGKFNDYIAMPKANMYQSLHTTVIGPDGQPVEVQIRTGEMHKTAEEGVAAHWDYKGIKGDKNFDKKLSWFRQILDWVRDSKSSREFIDILKVDFFEDEIYVFTPKGKVIPLPKESTPLDFAYSVHSSIGDTCVGCIVNGSIVPLRHKLETGDIVRVLTSNTAVPRLDWLKIVKTGRAKDKIRQAIRRRGGIPFSTPVSSAPLSESSKEQLVNVPLKDVSVKLAKCCHPLPGDSIVGYPSRRRMFVVHRVDCSNTRGKSLEELSWHDGYNRDLELKIIAADRVGLFADIFNTVASTGTNVRDANAKMISDDLAECSLSFVAENTDHIRDIVNRIRRVQSVRKVFIENK